MKIGIQGVRHSFHHQAAQIFFKERLTAVVETKDFAELFDLLSNGRLDAAVCAVENTIFGSINDVYDLLSEYPGVWIGGEQLLAIHHCLCSIPGSSLPIITDVYSHPVALGQCRKYLNNKLPSARRHSWQDTAAAAHMIAKKGNGHLAAICSREAAEEHGLVIIQASIEDHLHNTTRFLVLYSSEQRPSTPDKTSLVLEVPHQPGSLYDTLGVFKLAGINLSMLMSRPLPEHPWKYRFYIDIETGLDSPKAQLALQNLASRNINLRVLGTYAKAKIIET